MKKSLLICMIALMSASLLPAQVQFGGGAAPQLQQKTSCLSPQERASEWAHTQQMRQQLIEQGKLTDRRNAARSVQNTTFSWPLRKSPNAPFMGYYGITNYVDHDATTGLQDYNCNGVTYDGHRGTDYATWPFPWEMMDNDDVEVIAAAKGVILEKRDGHFDQSCDWNNKPWNAVYVEHEDGSIAWYGHLKKNTLTTKAVGDTVFPGDFLGYIGSSGISTGPHLHFELFSAGGGMLDPYDGNCNNTSATSRWDSQNPYRSPSLIHMQTGDAAPDYGNFCYGQEASNVQVQFQPGDRIYYSIYPQDYLTNLTTTFRVIDPSGAIFDTWTHSPNTSYSLSYWWWWRDIPNSAPEGEWKLEVDFNGETFTHSYLVGNTTAINLLGGKEIAIGPNPMSDFVIVELAEPLKLAYSLVNLQGKQVLNGTLEGKKIELSSLPTGVYILNLRDIASGEQLNKRLVKR